MIYDSIITITERSCQFLYSNATRENTKNNFKHNGANNSANNSRVEPRGIHDDQSSDFHAIAKGERFRYRRFRPSFNVLDHTCASVTRRINRFFQFSGIFICLKCHRFPKTSAIRAIDDQWMRAKRIARNDIRRAMSYREEPITRAVIYDCISVPFGRRRYIIRIPTRREFIYSIIIAHNR